MFGSTEVAGKMPFVNHTLYSAGNMGGYDKKTFPMPLLTIKAINSRNSLANQ